MDKLNTLSNEERAAALHNFKENDPINLNSINVSSVSGASKYLKSEIEPMPIGKDVTINVPIISEANHVSPNRFVSKTEETLGIIIESDSQNVSKNVQENRNMCDNREVKVFEGRYNKTKRSCNQNTKEAPSIITNPKAIMSESLSNLLVYGSSSEDSEPDSAQSLSDSESDSEDESSNDGNVTEKDSTSTDIITGTGQYRKTEEYILESESSSDESSNAESDAGAVSRQTKQTPKKSSTEGELDLDDLPPVPDLSMLNINIKAEDCLKIGSITSIVDRLVMVQSLPNTPAYDLDTLLFLEEGKQPLGYIYDVMGQVTSPIYVIRFNSRHEIESKGITKGLAVYSAPETVHTQYIFLKELMKMKGSDASWRGDNEVPTEFIDFSDDETEYISRQNHNNHNIFDKKRKRGSLEKHRMFETAMNLRNKADSARHQAREPSEPTPKRYIPPRNPSNVYMRPHNINQMRQQCSTSFPNFPPNFSTPPPNFGYLNMGPPMLSMGPFPFPPFPPNPQSFPQPVFGPPNIPPIPALPHVLPQPPSTVAFTGGIGLMATNMSTLSMPKQQVTITKAPKLQQNCGVVPKAQVNMPQAATNGLPKMFIPAPTPFPPSLGLPKSTVTSFTPNAPMNLPTTMPPPFGPPMPPWHIPGTPLTSRVFPHQHNGGRQFKKP